MTDSSCNLEMKNIKVSILLNSIELVNNAVGTIADNEETSLVFTFII